MGMQILIVEDDAFLADALSDILSDFGYDVHIADNGEDGLNYAIQNVPNLIITDFHLPVLNGLQLIEGVRQNAACASVPVILATGMTSTSLDSATAVHLMAKPYDVTDLLDKVEALIA